MNILDHGIHISQLMTTNDINNALDLITINGAKALNIDDSYGIKCGNNANFIVLDAKMNLMLYVIELLLLLLLEMVIFYSKKNLLKLNNKLIF